MNRKVNKNTKICKITLQIKNEDQINIASKNKINIKSKNILLSNSELKNVNLTNQVMPTIENDNDQIKSILKKDKSSKITKNISFAN